MTIKVFRLAIYIVLLISACKQESTYHSLVKAELAKNVRNDSLFLGLAIGMSQVAFYDTCWALNKQGLTREGAMNTTVHYPFEELSHKGALDFFPIFSEGKVQSMTGHTMYDGWSPWKKELWSEHLIEDTKNMFERWFPGNLFFPIKSPGIGKAYVKIDGNRRIVLLYTNDQRVEFLISDLTNPDDVLKLNN